MSEKELICETKVKYSGIFNFKDLYNFVYDFLTDKGFFVEEKSYSEKVKPEGKEIEIKWVCLKKITDYFRYEIVINFRITGLLDVEITKEGKKFVSNKGDVEIKFSGSLERDYENKFETSAFLKFMRGVYDKYVIKSRIEKMEDKLAEIIVESSNQVKAYLALEAKR
jgi:hypothetical protein